MTVGFGLACIKLSMRIDSSLFRILGTSETFTNIGFLPADFTFQQKKKISVQNFDLKLSFDCNYDVLFFYNLIHLFLHSRQLID